MAKFPETSHFLNVHDSSLGHQVNAASYINLEIQANYITKPRTLFIQLSDNLSHCHTFLRLCCNQACVERDEK